MRSRLGISIIATLTAAGFATVGRAQTPQADPSAQDAPSEVAEAREAFLLGSALANQGQWLDAVAAFQRSSRLRPHPVTTYNIGYCERALARFARATRNFSLALEPPLTPEAPRLPPDLEALARAYLAEVEQRIARVTITLATANMALKVDGHSLEPFRPGGSPDVQVIATEDPATPAALPPTFDLWLDPGAHVFVVVAADGASSVESHTFAPGDSAALRFPTVAVAEGAVSPGVAGAESVATAPPKADAVAPVQGVPLRTLGLLVGGVGIVGLGISGFFGLRTRSLDNASKGEGLCNPNNQCTAVGLAKRNDAITASNIATATLVAGGVLTAGGVTLFLLGGPKQRPGEARVEATPMVGPGGAVMSVHGRF